MAFTLNAQDLAKHALSLIGALGHGEDIQGDDYNLALTSLNLVLEYIQRLGNVPINVTTETVDMVASTSNYNLSNTDTIDIISAYVRDSAGIDRKVDIVPQTIYDGIGDKDYEDQLPKYLVFNRTATPSITLWPVPNDATIDVVVRSVLSTSEASASTNTLDIPNALYYPTLYLLAGELAMHFNQGIRKADYLRARGRQILTEMFSEIKDKWDSDAVPGAFDE